VRRRVTQQREHPFDNPVPWLVALYRSELGGADREKATHRFMIGGSVATVKPHVVLPMPPFAGFLAFLGMT
jgi:hypothetical protein